MLKIFLRAEPSTQRSLFEMQGLRQEVRIVPVLSQVGAGGICATCADLCFRKSCTCNVCIVLLLTFSGNSWLLLCLYSWNNTHLPKGLRFVVLLEGACGRLG